MISKFRCLLNKCFLFLPFNFLKKKIISSFLSPDSCTSSTSTKSTNYSALSNKTSPIPSTIPLAVTSSLWWKRLIYIRIHPALDMPASSAEAWEDETSRSISSRLEITDSNIWSSFGDTSNIRSF